MFKKFEKGHHYKPKMASSLYFLRNPLSVFGPLVLLAAILGLGFLSLSVIITFILLTLSTLVFKFTNQKQNLEQKDEILISTDDEKSPSLLTEDVHNVSEAEIIPEENESIPESEEKVEEVQEVDQCLARTSVSEQSESLGRSSTSEDSEVLDWMCQDGISRSPDWSDGSISDEESLIEIELPGGHFVGNNKEEKEEYSKKKNSDFDRLGYSFLKQQHGLFELFAELNDMNEENLIEIDISMGSIKCPRFEIEA